MDFKNLEKQRKEYDLLYSQLQKRKEDNPILYAAGMKLLEEMKEYLWLYLDDTVVEDKLKGFQRLIQSFGIAEDAIMAGISSGKEAQDILNDYIKTLKLPQQQTIYDACMLYKHLCWNT